MQNNPSALPKSMCQIDAPLPWRRPPNEIPRISDRQRPRQIPSLPAAEPSDQRLVGRFRAGDQEAATQLYFRYATRLTFLVRRRCHGALARCAGVEDIVQSVFGSFFRRIGEGYYDLSDLRTVWKLLHVIALNKIRSQATYYYAARRDAHRTVDGPEGRQRLEMQANLREPASEHYELMLNEILDALPPENSLMVRLRMDGFEVAEIARITRRSLRTVERVLHETRLRLSTLLRMGR